MILHFLAILVVSSAIATNSSDNLYLHLSEGNSLWTNILTECSEKPTMSCVEKNMFSYLRETMEYPRDFQPTSFLKLAKNNVDYERIVPDTNNATDAEKQQAKVEEPEVSTLEEMSRSLHEKSVKFLMTHDYQLQLPETFFHGAILKLSPRNFEENGALLKFEVVPKVAEAQGRLFKKLKNFISEKLVFAFLAILLVIKLLAAKFMFFLPMMVGAVTAKKLLIKVLLFLFPVLHHLFKLCAYVPHGAKLHHHKHHIAHIHHIGHGPPAHAHHGHHHGPHDSVEVIAPHAGGPPSLHGGHEEHVEHGPPWHGGQSSLHHYTDIEPPHKDYYKPHEQELEYYSGGPALSNHFINHRQDATDENEVQASPWGQGDGTKKKTRRPMTATEIENMILKAEKEAMIKARLQQERLKIQQENARLQEQLKQAMRLQDKLKQQTALVKNRLQEPKLSPPPPPPSQFVQAPQPAQQAQKKQQLLQQQLIAKQQLLQQQAVQQQQQLKVKQQLLQQQDAIVKQQEAIAKEKETVAKQPLATYDAFYSPILEKIDKILIGLNFNEEPCRERLICSMYKNPPKFSPHSNLLSAELSRDSKELQKPTNTNAAVIRFYRYVQAARDGQDKRDCLRLYPACAINTEQ